MPRSKQLLALVQRLVAGQKMIKCIADALQMRCTWIKSGKIIVFYVTNADDSRAVLVGCGLSQVLLTGWIERIKPIEPI